MTSEGVLVPELNYRNYKYLENFQPEFEKFIRGDALPLCHSAGTIIDSPVLWGVIGALIGGIVVLRLK